MSAVCPIGLCGPRFRLLVVLAVLLGWSWAAQARSKRPRRPPGDVLVIGSSSINGALGGELARGLEQRGFEVWRKGRSSSGLARPDFFDWPAEIEDLPIGPKTSGAVIYLGTNDAQAIRLRPAEARRLRVRGRWLRWDDPRWPTLYARRAEGFARALCKRGVPRVAYITPIDVREGSLRRRLARIRAALVAGTSKVKCARAFSGRGDLKRVLAEGRARVKGRKRSHRGAGPRLRQPDGTHLTWAGARAIWGRVGTPIVRWLDLGPVPKPKARGRKGRKGRKGKLKRSDRVTSASKNRRQASKAKRVRAGRSTRGGRVARPRPTRAARRAPRAIAPAVAAVSSRR